LDGHIQAAPLIRWFPAKNIHHIGALNNLTEEGTALHTILIERSDQENQLEFVDRISIVGGNNEAYIELVIHVVDG